MVSRDKYANNIANRVKNGGGATKAIPARWPMKMTTASSTAITFPPPSVWTTVSYGDMYDSGKSLPQTKPNLETSEHAKARKARDDAKALRRGAKNYDDFGSF